MSTLKTPLVSVIIPARNEFPQIAFTIQSIINDLETFLSPAEFEIIIVANCCDDWYNVERDRRGCGGTVDYLMPRGIYWNRVLQVIYDPIAGNHATRNKGVMRARGKYVFFSDGHMSYRRGFFKSMIETIDKTGGMVHGTIGWLGAYPVGISMGYQYTIKLGEEIKGCVDEKTEILTKKGWKKWNEVNYKTEFATVRMETKEIEFQKPTELTIYDHNGEAILFEGRSINALLTPNHRTIYDDYKNGWNIKPADKIDPHNHRIPIATRGYKGIKEPIYKDELVSLIGWIITEGNFREDGSICITQYNEENREIIKNLVERLEFTYFQKKRGDVIININPSKKIKEVLPRKELTFDFLLHLTKIQQQLLFDSLIAGDGWIGDKKTGARITNFYQVNTTTANAFQLLCVFLGKASRDTIKQPWKNRYGKKPIHHISIKKNKYTHGFEKKVVHYQGKMWCPTLPNGTIFIRRNGIVIATGQTWNNYKLADDYFYIPLQGHCCLGCLRKQFIEFDGYPWYHRCYGGGEFYLDMKWWLFGSSVVVDPQAIGYHLCAPRGYSYHHDDYVHNVMAIGMALGMDGWTERAYINWCRKGTPEVMKRLWDEAKKETVEDRDFITKKAKKTVNELLIERPWDKLNDKLHGKHNSSMLIFQDTIIPSFKGTPAQALYDDPKYKQKELADFIDKNLADKVYKRGYKPNVENARIIQHKR